jgi:Holliday junction resolvase
MNQYQRGARVEREVQKWLEARGFTTMRAAGSKGKIDVMAIRDDEQLFIQVKISDGLIKPAERRELIRLGRMAGATPLVAYKEETGEGNRVRVVFQQLTGTGPHDRMTWEPGVAPTPITEIRLPVGRREADRCVGCGEVDQPGCATGECCR